MSAPRPFRLLTVTNYFPSHGGGIERVAERLIDEFARLQVVVEWLSSDTDPPPESTANRSVVAVRAFNGVERITQLPYPIWSLSALPTLWRAIGNSDVVHVHEHLYFGSILGVCLARLHGRPVVVTQHMGALGLRARFLTAVYETLARGLGLLIFSLATRIVFISANVRDFFGRGKCAKTRLLFNGIDPQRFKSVPEEQRHRIRAELGIEPQRQMILFVGRYVRKKGLHILESLASRFSEPLWVFVGSGPEDPSRWKRENVLVLGRVPHDRLPGIYQTADLLILPSSGEGLPLVVQEALACGLGVLSTQEVRDACPAAKDMIRAHATPRTTPDIDGWERALREVLSDVRYLEGREERARHSHQLWSWEDCASQYLLLFDEITSKTRARKSAMTQEP
jgi:glycosyltransferase involved in cell wall biosynthesis